MTTKFLGAGLIIVTAYCYGCSVSAGYKRRVKQLEELLLALEIFKAEVNFGLSLLLEVFLYISKKISGPIGNIFSSTVKYMQKKEGLSVEECWRKSLQDRQGEIDLTKEHLELVYKMGMIWGKGDKNDQLRQVTLLQELLRQALQAARNDREKNEKLWRYLGLLGGIAAVILLA